MPLVSGPRNVELSGMIDEWRVEHSERMDCWIDGDGLTLLSLLFSGSVLYCCCWYCWLVIASNIELLQIEPNYKSIRKTTNRTESLQIDPKNYKSIRITTNRSENYKSNRITSNRSEKLQIEPNHYKSNRTKEEQSDLLTISEQFRNPSLSPQAFML